MNLEYLKPTFSAHPGNWMLAAVVGLLFFFVTSIATAGEMSRRYDVVQLPGESLTSLHNRMAALCNTHRYEWQNMGWSGWTESYSGGNCATMTGRDSTGPAVDGNRWWTLRKYDQASCAAAGATWNTTYCQVQPGISYYEWATGNCPVGTGDSDGDGLCNKECPAAGTVFSGTFATEPTDGPLTITIGGIRVVDECEVTPVYEKVACFWANEMDPNDPDTICRQLHHYEYTGANGTPSDPAPGDGPEEPAPTTEPIAAGDYTQDAKSYTPIEKTTEVMPDGTTVESEGYVESETKNIGPNITEDTTKTVINRSNGITKTTTYTVTTTTNPDGSKSVHEETTVSYDQTDKEVIAVTKDGYTTITNNPGYSGGSTTSKTTNYDSQGNNTGSNETTSYSGDESGKADAGQGEGEGEGEGEEGGKCDVSPAPVECEDVTTEGKESEGTDSWWESSYPDGLGGIWDSHTSGLGDMVGQSGIADIGIGSTSTDPAFCMDMNVMAGLGWGTMCASPDSSVWNFIALCLMITALFTARRLVFGG